MHDILCCFFLARELHSDYDAIMEASVMGDLDLTSSTESLGSKTLTDIETAATLPKSNVPSIDGLPVRQSVSLAQTSTSVNRLGIPAPPQRQSSTPIFEMSTLTLADEEVTLRRTQSAHSTLVKYETDSDEDMRHPALRSKFVDDDSDPPSPTLSFTSFLPIGPIK